MYPLSSMTSGHKRQNWPFALLFCCLLVGALLGRTRLAAAQTDALSVTITRPSEGETFYAGETSLLYSTPISGIVNSDNFDPEEIEIQLAIYQNDQPEEILRTTPDADGRFLFYVTVNPEGSSEAFGPDILYCGEYCHFKSEAALPSGATRLVVTATDPAGRRAESERHIIVDLSGQALVPVSVTLDGHPAQSLAGIPVSGSTWLYLWRARHHTAATNAAGEALVAVEALAEAPTRYTFCVEPSIVDGVLYESVAPVEVVLPPGATAGEPVNLTVSATLGQIAGDLAGGSVALDDSFRVAAIRLPSGSVRLTPVSADGSFSFTDIAIDRYLLAADNTALIEQGLHVNELPVDLTENVQVSVQMPVESLQGGSLRGAVLDAAGRPLPFAWVAAGNQVQSVLPDSGTYLFPNVPAGTKSLIVTAPGFYSKARAVEPSPGAAGESEIRLKQQPGTERVVWGSGEVLVPADSKVEVAGDRFILERGWLWGQGHTAESVFINAGSTTIAIERGAFALEYRPNLRSWFYLLAGEARVWSADDMTPLQLQANQMINLQRNDRGDFEVVAFNPLVVRALQPSYSSSPSPLVWEPTLKAQIRDRLARIGIGTAQIVTFLTYFLGVLSIAVVPLLFLYWQWRQNRSAMTRLRSEK